MSNNTPAHAYPADRRIANNKQSGATVAILNTVRWLGTVTLTGIAGLLVIATLVVGVKDGAGYAFGVFAVAVVMAIYAALFYAVVGWFVDTLSLLKQIAERP